MSQPQQFISYQRGMENTRQNVDMPTNVSAGPVAPAPIPDTMDGRMDLLGRYEDLKAKAAARGMDLSFDAAAQLLQVNPQELGQVAQNAGVPTQPTVPVAQPTMAEQQGTGAPVAQPSMADAQGTGAVPTQPSMADAQAPARPPAVSPAPTMAEAQAGPAQPSMAAAQGTGFVPVERPNMAQAQQPSMAQAQAGRGPVTQAPSMAQQQAPTQQSAQRAKVVNPYASGASTPSMAQGQAPSQQQAQSARRATQQQAQRNRRGRQTNRGYGQGRR